MKNHRIASHVGVGVLSVALGWYLGQRDGATPGPTDTHDPAQAAPAHRATLAAGDAGPTSAERGATTALPRPPPAPQAAATAPPDGTVSGNETAAKDRPDTPQAARQNTEANDAALIPFLLADVAGIARLNQGDGVHPTAEGQRILARTVGDVVVPIAREAAPASEHTNGV